MKAKHKCKYCNKKIYSEGGVCPDCKEKLKLVRKLLRMVKTAAGKEVDVDGRS